MYNFNWSRFIRSMVDNTRRKIRHIAWLEVLLSQVKWLHSKFLVWQADILFKLSYSSQIIYLEKRLNDKWDSSLRGIYIENVADTSAKYIYRKAELRPKTFVHKKWDNSISYSIGSYVNYGESIYRAVDATTIGLVPAGNTSEWYEVRKRLYLVNKIEGLTVYDFIVWVPTYVVFDINEMKALINFYKLAGKRYIIQTY